MTTIATGLDTAVRGCFASIQGQIYFGNNFNALKVWNGLTATMQDAGITGPSGAMGTTTSVAAGNTTNGAHRLRYRYKNSKTGYVSNPSNEVTVTVSSGNGALTFNISTAATPIIRSSDAKVDTILVEMTPVNGGEWYQAGSALNSATSIVINIADTSLIQQIASGVLYGTAENGDLFAHEVPPVASIIISYKGRTFIGGDEAYSIASVSFTNGSAAVTGTGFSTAWVGRLIRAASDAVAYEITAATSTTITLAAVYAGSTGSYTCLVYSRFPNRVKYSRLGMPESFFEGYARDLLQNRSDTLSGLYGRREGMYVLGRYSSERLVFNDDPSAVTSETRPIHGNRGVFNQRCLVEAEGRLFAMDRMGIYEVGETPTHLSFAVDDALTELADYSAYVKFHAAYDPRDRILLFFFVRSGDTQPKYAVCLELDSGRWFFDHWFQGITASAIVPTTDGQVRLLLGDENGYSWFFSVDGSWDGVPPSTSAVVTATGTPTTTVISVTETLDTSPSLAGVVLYNPANGETAVVSSNTSSQITVGSGLTVAPSSGDTLYLGPISWEWRTKWVLPPQGHDWKMRPVYLKISLYPGTSTGKLRVYIFQDFSATPTTVTATASDLYPDGTTVTTGTTYIDVDLDGGQSEGYVAVPLPADFHRAIQARITSIRPDGELRLLDAAFEFHQPDTAEMEDE